MAVFLSPGVFPREIDLSVLPSNNSTIIPAFVGTTKKGPVNEPRYITSAEQFIETFGEPFTDSSLGYAVLSYLEEGNAAWVLRVVIECSDGQDADLAAVCVDTSGNKLGGWGRIPVFTGIDYGKLSLRIPTEDEPFVFHDDSIGTVSFVDADESTTLGEAVATLSFSGSGLSSNYTGAIDDSFVLTITGDPTESGSVMGGATYSVIRNSDGITVSSGTITESVPGESDPIEIGEGDESSGLTCSIVVSGDVALTESDSFTFSVVPNNLTFDFEVDGAADVGPISFTDGDSYDDIDDFVEAFNDLLSSTAAGDYIAVNDGGTLYIRTVTAGERIQISGSEAFALEVGVSKWAYDIPRSHVMATNVGTFNINANNNRVVFNLVTSTERIVLESTVPVSSVATPEEVATAINLAGTKSGIQYFTAFAMNYTDDTKRVVAVVNATNQLNQLKLMADYSNPQTLRFAEELDILYPYTTNYRVFSDSRVSLPDPGETTPATPLSCEEDDSSAQCALDTAYFANIVGFFVASSPGTWLNDYSVTLQPYGANVGKYEILVYDNNGILVDRIGDVSFDANNEKYVADLLNPGGDSLPSSLGGVGTINGNRYIHWEERPSYLDNTPTDDDYEPRLPGTFTRTEFVGMANGIPDDASNSSLIDAAIIGNASRQSGLFAFDNPERYDISLLSIPGNSSGAVIAAGLQFCERRSDCLYVIDPPFGLRPQQVVDWHNGILLSDLANSLNSSYGALYWSWLKIFDQFNGGEIYVPPSGHVCSVFARSARESELWFAPAGLNRGRLLSALDVEFNPTIGERDLLYGFNNAVNPIVNFFQDGITVFGQRTLQRKDSALDRVNVRMLLIFIKKNLVRTLRNFLFEPNDRFLRKQVVNTIDPFLGDIAARRGLTAYKIVCDDTNNTPERIDRNELWVSILLKPTRAVEFIVLNLAVLRTDAGFSSEEILATAGAVT